MQNYGNPIVKNSTGFKTQNKYYQLKPMVINGFKEEK